MATSHVTDADRMQMLRSLADPAQRGWLLTPLEVRAVQWALQRLAAADQLREVTKMIAEDDGEAD